MRVAEDVDVTLCIDSDGPVVVRIRGATVQHTAGAAHQSAAVIVERDQVLQFAAVRSATKGEVRPLDLWRIHGDGRHLLRVGPEPSTIFIAVLFLRLIRVPDTGKTPGERSEEHTSELQSR